MFIVKTSNKHNDSETFIADSCATSHMVNLEENLMKLEYAKTRVSVGDSRTLTFTTCNNWRSYWRHDENTLCYKDIKYGRNTRPTRKYIKFKSSTTKGFTGDIRRQEPNP